MKVEGDWERDGYVVLRGAYSADTVAELLAAAEHCWALYETDPHALPAPRAAGKSTANDTCMRHLNHPGYLTPGSRGFRALMEAVADPAVLEQLARMFGNQPLFRSTSLFVNPREKSSEGSWHRDSQFLIPNEDEERQALHDMKVNGLLNARGCQMQVALVPSDDVELVKGSHLRWDLPAEYAVRRADGGRNSTGVMPGSTRIALQPGDAVCFNSWGYHRGRYHTDKSRRTLMFTYTGEHFSTFDYFSDQPWILEENYLDGLSPGCQAFFRTYAETFGDRIRAKRAGMLQGSGEGRHAAYPKHLQQFYSQATQAKAPTSKL